MLLLGLNFLGEDLILVSSLDSGIPWLHLGFVFFFPGILGANPSQHNYWHVSPIRCCLVLTEVGTYLWIVSSILNRHVSSPFITWLFHTFSPFPNLKVYMQFFWNRLLASGIWIPIRTQHKSWPEILRHLCNKTNRMKVVSKTCFLLKRLPMFHNLWTGWIHSCFDSKPLNEGWFFESKNISSLGSIIFSNSPGVKLRANFTNWLEAHFFLKLLLFWVVIIYN